MVSKTTFGHFITFITIFIWGITFVSTKVLLRELSPVEILFYRFLLAYIVLLIISPRFKRTKGFSEEMLFFGLGLTGVCLYFLVENIALEFTLASNVGVLVSTVPILTAILSHFATEDEKLNPNIIIGFLVAILGVFLVIFNGKYILKLNPLGDCLALLASVVWAVYSVLLKKVDRSYKQIYVVRKTFFYGLLIIVPILFLLKEDFKVNSSVSLSIILNISFLGFAASALCFVMWNKAVSIIGAIKASNYIYLVPLVTTLTSIIVLHEKINWLMACGGLLILSGVYISEKGIRGLAAYKAIGSIFKLISVK